MAYTAAVITVSDKGFRGERTDTSGPAICAILRERGWETVHTAMVPDDAEAIKAELISCADEKGINLILTTGGTGFSPRDITPEATLAVVERETRGIPEAMRAESMKITPRGCLSRSAAGIRGRSLIVNLPGSEKAAKENLLAVIEPIAHGLEMLLGSGSADCAGHSHHHGHSHGAPSLDDWLQQAKALPEAGKIGMFLSHRGVVRESARAAVREGKSGTERVKAMLFSYDREKAEAVAAEARELPGIYHVRVWLAEGELGVGEDLMQVLIGGDVRPHVVEALQYVVSRLKNECVSEKEIF